MSPGLVVTKVTPLAVMFASSALLMFSSATCGVPNDRSPLFDAVMLVAAAPLLSAPLVLRFTSAAVTESVLPVLDSMNVSATEKVPVPSLFASALITVAPLVVRLWFSAKPLPELSVSPPAPVIAAPELSVSVPVPPAVTMAPEAKVIALAPPAVSVRSPSTALVDRFVSTATPLAPVPESAAPTVEAPPLKVS